MNQAGRPQRPRRASRHGRGRGPGPWRRRAGWAVLALVVLVSGVAGYVLWTLRDLPDPGQQPVLAHSIVVYDRKGRQIEQRNASGHFYQPLRLQDMGRWNIYATLAAEDREFYHHGPIDFPATARAAFQDLVHHSYEQGGSTITQQLVKIDLLTSQKSIFRKMQEAVLATALEQRYSKDQILEMYLNRVYYGHNAYGLGAATRVYFGAGTQAKDLTPAEAALLAGLINGPSYYDPQLHFDRAKERQLYVLDGMVKMGVLTRAQAEEAAREDVRSELKFDQSLQRSLAPHFVQWVIEQLDARFGPGAEQQGYAVYTTLDLDLQSAAQQAVTTGVRRLARLGVNNGDLLAADPRTGAILAWVGSADYFDDNIAGQVDVVLSPRQPGSSFKPYVYEAALRDHRITLATTLHDRPTDFGGYRPLDYDNRYLGDMSARRALLLSRNVPAVEVAQMEGIQNVIDLAHQLGIRSRLNPVLSTGIGASEVTMLEHLQGYQTFADQGTLMPLMAITEVLDANGEVVYKQQPGTQPGISHPLTPAQAYLITDVLKDYPSYWHLGWNRQMAGKSGTSGGTQIGVHPDAWMMAYNPDIVVGAWAGNTAPPERGGGHPVAAFGVDVGSNILAQFINSLPDSMRDWYRQPDGIVTGAGCPGSPWGREIFLAGTQGGVGCPTPSATPSPAATPSVTPQPTISPSGPAPSSPQPTPSPLPLPTLPLPSPSPAPAAVSGDGRM